MAALRAFSALSSNSRCRFQARKPSVFGLARRVAEGDRDFDVISGLPDDDASLALQQIKGVGPWTAAIYLLFCEGRGDIWPVRDVALKSAYNAAASASLSQEDLEASAAAWAPHRGIAAHILWTYYAHLRGRAPI